MPLNDILIVDVETTGVNANEHSILSIGAVIIPKNSRDIIYNLYNEANVWPGAEITEQALQINNFKRDEIINNQIKLNQKEMLEQLIEFSNLSNDITIWGHNPKFDVDFINTSFKRENIDFKFSYHTLDLHTIAYIKHIENKQKILLKNKSSSLNGDEIMKYVGIPAEPNPHNALNGAKWEAEAIHRLLYGANFHPDFKKYSIPTYLKHK